jgi:hypothetical protein
VFYWINDNQELITSESNPTSVYLDKFNFIKIGVNVKIRKNRQKNDMALLSDQ